MLLEFSGPDGKVSVVKNNIAAMVKPTKTYIERGINCHIYVVGDNDPFNIYETYEEVRIAYNKSER